MTIQGLIDHLMEVEDKTLPAMIEVGYKFAEIESENIGVVTFEDNPSLDSPPQVPGSKVSMFAIMTSEFEIDVYNEQDNTNE